jgi:uncharacterized protein
MLRSSVSRIVDFCSRHAWWVIVLGVALAAASSLYTLRHFAIKTDIKDLFPSDLPWAQRALDYMKTFPQPSILVVVDAPTPEFVEQASTRLTRVLASRPDLILAVHQLQGGPFFERNGLLYLPTDEVVGLTQGLVHAGPLLQTLAADPSLRGALNGLSLGLMGVQYGQIQLDVMALALVCTMAAAVLFQPALMGRPRERAVWVVRREVPMGAWSEARPRAESRRFRAEHALARARDHDRAPEDKRGE